MRSCRVDVFKPLLSSRASQAFLPRAWRVPEGSLLHGRGCARYGSTTAPATPAVQAAGSALLAPLGTAADHSWLRQLEEDPEAAGNTPNRAMREVRSGHFVPVAPTPLPEPRLVAYSPAVAEMLGLSDEACRSEAFARFFSGDQAVVKGLRPWCTPYALTIMGNAVYNNCPFGNGNGYGDGRAISIGEVVVGGARLEMQLKGAGRTPFCRGFDGRAVLRSSVREFLASEAMHALGVETTRALSLVTSSAVVQRHWYSKDSPGILGRWSQDPDTVVEEQCAISTRVAPSFIRVGHLDLFARRVRNERTERAAAEYIQMLRHALFREFPDLLPDAPLPERVVAMLQACADQIGKMVAGWLRVGFCQGNFNADNCLIAGRTMDYGPFGWIEVYDPMFAKWTGSRQHYAFMSQPTAAISNFAALVNSCSIALVGKDTQDQVKEIFDQGARRIASLCEDVFREKLGFATAGETPLTLWRELETIMLRSKVDYTILYRELAALAEVEDDALLEVPAIAFYEPASEELSAEWSAWLVRWRSAIKTEVLVDDGGSPAERRRAAAKRMRSANPKYVLREWMLVAAYETAEAGDFALVNELHELCRKPYDEQPEFHARYYQRAPAEVLNQGGCAWMS